jgi:hypothetical protein
VIAFNFKDSLKELVMRKCGLSLDTLEFISAGIYSGLKVECGADGKVLESADWDHDWNSPYKVNNRFNLEKIDLSYNKFGNPTSWRIFLRNFLMFTRESLQEIDLQSCGLTNL